MTLAYPNYNKHFNNSINFNPLSSYPLQPLDKHDHGLNPKPNIKSLSFNPMEPSQNNKEIRWSDSNESEAWLNMLHWKYFRKMFHCKIFNCVWLHK